MLCIDMKFPRNISVKTTGTATFYHKPFVKDCFVSKISKYSLDRYIFLADLLFGVANNAIASSPRYYFERGPKPILRLTVALVRSVKATESRCVRLNVDGYVDRVFNRARTAVF